MAKSFNHIMVDKLSEISVYKTCCLKVENETHFEPLTDHHHLQVEKKGVIYFEDVCKLILRKFREDDETEFIKIMFKVREC